MLKKEDGLSPEERWALAWYHLNNWEWDELLGAKPEGFDGLPEHLKMELIECPMQRIREVLGDAGLSWLLWKLANGDDREAWMRLYITRKKT